MTIILIPDNGRGDVGSVVVGLDGVQRGVVRIVPSRSLPSGATVNDYTGVLYPEELPVQGAYWYRGQLIECDEPVLASLPQGK